MAPPRVHPLPVVHPLLRRPLQPAAGHLPHHRLLSHLSPAHLHGRKEKIIIHRDSFTTYEAYEIQISGVGGFLEFGPFRDGSIERHFLFSK